MDEANLFQRTITNESEKLNKELFNLRLETKLSLRKKKVNDIIFQKRMLESNNSINNKNDKLEFKLLYDPTKVQFISDDSKTKYNLNFKEMENKQILSLATNYLKSENIDDIKYGIILTQIFIKRKIKEDLVDSINLLFIYELFHLIDKVKSDKEIIFNILNIIVSYSFINEDKNLATVLLSPNSYKIWENCFKLEDFEIFYAMICIFNNIIQNNLIGSCNLIRSNFLNSEIFNFYMNEGINAQKNNEDKSDINYHIIKDGISLFCNLLIISSDNLDNVTKEEIKQSKQKIINILLVYYDSKIYENHYKCIYSMAITLEQDFTLFSQIEKNHFIENVLLNKKFFDDKDLLFYLNKIFGNYLAYKTKIDKRILLEIMNFEANYLKICQDSYKRKDIFWALSNILVSDTEIYEKIFEINGLLLNIFECLKNSYSFLELKEILYFFGVLLSFVNNKYFIEIEKNQLLDIVLYQAKNIFSNRVELLNLCFQIFEIYLSFGQLMSKYFEGKNLIKDKFDKLGGKELLEKYINFSDVNISKQIVYIYNNYY